MVGRRKVYGENKLGGGMGRSVRTSEKRRLQKLWKVGGSKSKYLGAKRKAPHSIYRTKRNSEKGKFASVKDNKENIFCVAKQMDTQKQIQSNDGNLSLDDASKKLA